jgi:hypothetical protein
MRSLGTPARCWLHRVSGFPGKEKWVNKTSCTLEIDSRQESFEEPITLGARRLLLGASIRLLTNRFNCGLPVLQEDLLRLGRLADDAIHRVSNGARHV